MKTLGFIFTIVLSVSAFAGGNPCTYNSATGTLLGSFAAGQPSAARGWAPVALQICKASSGATYLLTTYNGVGLGPVTEPPQVVNQTALILAGYDEKAVFSAFAKNPKLETVVFTGDSKTQVTVYRNQMGRLLSNTLYSATK